MRVEVKVGDKVEFRARVQDRAKFSVGIGLRVRVRINSMGACGAPALIPARANEPPNCETLRRSISYLGWKWWKH